MPGDTPRWETAGGEGRRMSTPFQEGGGEAARWVRRLSTTDPTKARDSSGLEGLGRLPTAGVRAEGSPYVQSGNSRPAGHRIWGRVPHFCTPLSYPKPRQEGRFCSRFSHLDGLRDDISSGRQTMHKGTSSNERPRHLKRSRKRGSESDQWEHC